MKIQALMHVCNGGHLYAIDSDTSEHELELLCHQHQDKLLAIVSNEFCLLHTHRKCTLSEYMDLIKEKYPRLIYLPPNVLFLKLEGRIAPNLRTKRLSAWSATSDLWMIRVGAPPAGDWDEW